MAVVTEVFWMDDGDCCLRVGDVHFNIHHSLLLPDALQENLFTRAATSTEADGSPEQPIVLAGVSVNELRSFLRFAYTKSDIPDLRLLALRSQFHDLIQATAVGRRLKLASFCRRMHRLVLRVLCADDDEVLRSCSVETYVSLLELSRQHPVKNGNLEGLVVDAWIRRLDELGSIQTAIEVGESMNLRKLLGFTYYAVLKMLDADAADALATDPYTSRAVPFCVPADLLHPIHRERILVGAWSLNHAWSRIISTVPPLPTPWCTHAGAPRLDPRCNCPGWWAQAWATAVAEVLVEFAECDVLTKLARLRAVILSDRAISCVTVRNAADGILRGMLKDLRSEIPSHFLGPAPGERVVRQRAQDKGPEREASCAPLLPAAEIV
ncbi:unnamed protein product [Mycena citricolor]|uniref:BTB domain-containing protein n=1 Tax=Mycena citricolor TaxID=2018698 RepID=A0AAD2K0C7_9AGAR|nr:unnamed protein product [Mycena citricolor]